MWRKWIKRLRCKHEDKKCITNIHGDLRNIYKCCSIWECENCGKWFRVDKVEPTCNYSNFRKVK